MSPGKTSRPRPPGIDVRSLQWARRGVACFLAGLVVALAISAGWSGGRVFVRPEQGLLLSALLLVWVLSLLFLRGALQPLVEAVEKLETSVRRVERSLRSGREGLRSEDREPGRSDPPPESPQVSQPLRGTEERNPPARASAEAPWEDREADVEPETPPAGEERLWEPALSGLVEERAEAGGDPLPVEALMAAWDRYLSEGDGSFNRAGFLEFFEPSRGRIQIWPGDELELGTSVLIAGRSLREELLLLPNFNKAPRELAAWFDSESGPRNPRVQHLLRPARVKGWVHGARVEVRGLVS